MPQNEALDSFAGSGFVDDDNDDDDVVVVVVVLDDNDDVIVVVVIVVIFVVVVAAFVVVGARVVDAVVVTILGRKFEANGARSEIVRAQSAPGAPVGRPAYCTFGEE